MCLEIHTHMCVKAMGETLNYRFEIEQRRVNGKVWGRTRIGKIKKNVLYLKKIKEMVFKS